MSRLSPHFSQGANTLGISLETVDDYVEDLVCGLIATAALATPAVARDSHVDEWHSAGSAHARALATDHGHLRTHAPPFSAYPERPSDQVAFAIMVIIRRFAEPGKTRVRKGQVIRAVGVPPDPIGGIR